MPKVKTILRQAKRLDRSGIRDVNLASLPVVYSLSEWETMIGLKMTFVVTISSMVVAYASCDTRGCIVSFAVLEKYRRQGLGRQLLQYTINSMKDAKYPSLHLRVKVSNQEALKLYQDLGFEIKEELKDYYGVGDPAYYMVLSLINKDSSATQI